jgi:hypothetical protein
MIYKNFTPHELTIVSEDGTPQLVLPSGGQIRATEEIVSEESSIFDSEYNLEIPVVQKRYTITDNLPKASEGDVIIVSLIVLNAMRETGLDTSRFYAPDTGPDSVVRDDDGRIIGVRRLQQVVPSAS